MNRAPRTSSMPWQRSLPAVVATLLVGAGLAPTSPVQAQVPTATPSPVAALSSPASEPAPPTGILVPPTGAAEPHAATPELGVPKVSGAPATPPAAVVPTPVPEDPNRIKFNLTFPKERGGGAAGGSAATLEYVRETYVVLTGDVKLKYQTLDIAADRVELDLGTQIVTAVGHVILDQGPRRLSGDTLTFDLETKTGTLENATAQVKPDYYFTGRQITKTGDDTYEVVDGVFTSCSQKTPDWSITLTKASLEVEGYARIHNAVFKAKRLPLLYAPYILWPARKERTSGLLIPNIGYSELRGSLLGLAYYQVLGRSYDTTFHFDGYSKKYYGIGDEFRYNPTEGTWGTFLGYAIKDPTLDKWRWKLELNQITNDLPFGMRGVISYQKVSDFDYYRDFERDITRNSLRSTYSRGFATGNWGPHLLNILLDDRETFVNAQNDTIQQRKLPEVEYRLRSTELGKLPLYLQFRGALDYLDIARPGSYAGRYGRVDVFPELTVPIRTVPWLSFSLTGGERLTWYGSKVSANGQALESGGVTRTLPTGSAELIGPSFTKIFDGFGGIAKFKHVIEPRWTYTYQGTIDKPQEIPLFDEVDFQFATNVGRVALDNRVLAKPKDEKESAREILLVEVARSFSFNNDQPLQSGQGLDKLETTKQGPLEGLIRFNPTKLTSLKIEATYNTLFKHLTGTAVSGNLVIHDSSFGTTWFSRYDAVTGDKQSDQVGFFGSFDIIKDRLHMDAQVSYDAHNRLLQNQRYVASYTSQCWGLQLELRNSKAGFGVNQITTTDYRFSVSLKNVGTFFDLTGRTQAGQ